MLILLGSQVWFNASSFCLLLKRTLLAFLYGVYFYIKISSNARYYTCINICMLNTTFSGPMLLLGHTKEKCLMQLMFSSTLLGTSLILTAIIHITIQKLAVQVDIQMP